MSSSASNENGKDFSILDYMVGKGLQAGAAVDSAMQTKVPVLGSVGDVVQTVASRIPVAGNIVEIAQEAASAVEKARQPGLTRTQTVKSLSSSLFFIAIRRHPLYSVLKIALFAGAAALVLIVAILVWWLA